MEPKEIVSMIVTLESDIENLYDEFCNNEINRTSFKKQSREIIEKQIDLINQFKKEVTLGTLRKVQMGFMIQSDLSTQTHGYRRLCEEIEQLIKQK